MICSVGYSYLANYFPSILVQNLILPRRNFFARTRFLQKGEEGGEKKKKVTVKVLLKKKEEEKVFFRAHP